MCDICGVLPRAFCQQSVLCIGEVQMGRFQHPGITNMNNLSTLADLEAKVVGISFVKSQLKWHLYRHLPESDCPSNLPSHYFFSPVFTICNNLVYLFACAFMIHLSHQKVGSVKSGILLFFLYILISSELRIVPDTHQTLNKILLNK